MNKYNAKKIQIKPLSVNNCWQGRRFKTKLYKQYEKDLLTILPPLEVPEGKLLLKILVGFSSKLSDVDNMQKPFIDILQKKYKFNDNKIYRIEIEKTIVKKGDEFIKFSIDEFI
jgi:Holliday junction resolvase RusA-like endonuclease